MATTNGRRLLAVLATATMVAACGGGNDDGAIDVGAGTPNEDATTTGSVIQDDEGDADAEAPYDGDVTGGDATGDDATGGDAAGDGAMGASAPSTSSNLCEAVSEATMSSLTGRSAAFDGPGAPIMCTYDLDDSGDFVMLQVFQGERLATERDTVVQGRKPDSDIPNIYPDDHTVGGLPAYGNDWTLLVDAGDWMLHVSGAYGLVLDYDGEVTPELLIGIAEAALAGIAASGGLATPAPQSPAGSPAGMAPPMPTDLCALVDDDVIVGLTGSPLAPWMTDNPVDTGSGCGWWLELGGVASVNAVPADFDPGVTAAIREVGSVEGVETFTIAGWPAFGFVEEDAGSGYLSAGLYVDLGEWLLLVDISEDTTDSQLDLTLDAARGIAEAALG